MKTIELAKGKISLGLLLCGCDEGLGGQQQIRLESSSKQDARVMYNEEDSGLFVVVWDEGGCEILLEWA